MSQTLKEDGGAVGLRTTGPARERDLHKELDGIIKSIESTRKEINDMRVECAILAMDLSTLHEPRAQEAILNCMEAQTEAKKTLDRYRNLRVEELVEEKQGEDGEVREIGETVKEAEDKRKGGKETGEEMEQEGESEIERMALRERIEEVGTEYDLVESEMETEDKGDEEIIGMRTGEGLEKRMKGNEGMETEMNEDEGIGEIRVGDGGTEAEGIEKRGEDEAQRTLFQMVHEDVEATDLTDSCVANKFPSTNLREENPSDSETAQGTHPCETIYAQPPLEFHPDDKENSVQPPLGFIPYEADSIQSHPDNMDPTNNTNFGPVDVDPAQTSQNYSSGIGISLSQPLPSPSDDIGPTQPLPQHRILPPEHPEVSETEPGDASIEEIA